jgi:thiol-disulfide isomerase/thioredoxin
LLIKVYLNYPSRFAAIWTTASSYSKLFILNLSLNLCLHINKKILFFEPMKTRALFILLSAVLGLASLEAAAQDSTIKAPYEKFTDFPPVKLLLPDSTTFTREDLPKKKPVLVMLFSPMCEHCKHETVELLKNIDKLEDVEILMVTSNPFDSMRVFVDRFGLANYKNIVVTYDPQFFLITYFQLHNLPFLAFYDKRKKFMSIFEGNMPMDKVIETFKKAE